MGTARPRRLKPLWSSVLGVLGALLLGGGAPALARPGTDPAGDRGPEQQAAPAPAGAEERTGADDDDPSAYRRHMDNGIKLFEEENYRAAIVEFAAAYQAKPKASPLVNIALSQKALRDYPKAIEALERAIEQHADTLEPEHLRAAKREVAQLRQLLAYVTVRVEPADATVWIDGQRLPAGRVGKPLALGPGPHDLVAKLAGYAPAERQVTLTSGQHVEDLSLVLSPLGGQVRVVLRESGGWVQIDGMPPSPGGFEGMLTPGVHQITVFRHGDDERRSLQILVGAGKSHRVTEDDQGRLQSAAAVSERPAEPPEDEAGPRRGFYFMGHAALLGIVGPQPDGFTKSDAPAGGAGIGARVGYRVADWAAFEGLGQLTTLGAEGDLEPVTPLPDQAKRYVDTEYNLQSLRLGAGFRVLFPGRSFVRFVGIGSAGLTLERLRWENASGTVGLPGQDPSVVSARPYDDSDGIGAFGQLELGVEFEVSNVLLAMLVRNGVQSTSGLAVENDAAPWGDKPLWLLGLSAHVGYGIW